MLYTFDSVPSCLQLHVTTTILSANTERMSVLGTDINVLINSFVAALS